MSRPRGRPIGSLNKEKPFREALRMELADGGDMRKLRRIAAALIGKAMDGDVQSAVLIADRLDGKPLQSVEVGKPGDFDHMDDNALDTFIASRAGIPGNGAGRKGTADRQAGVRSKPGGLH